MIDRLRMDGHDVGELIPDMVGGLLEGLPEVPYYTARVPLRVDGQAVPVGAEVPFGRVVIFEPLPYLDRALVDGDGAWWASAWLGQRARLERLDEPPSGLMYDRRRHWPTNAHAALYELVTRGAACPITPQICQSCACARRFPWRA